MTSMQKDITEIKIAVARIEETLKSLAKGLSKCDDHITNRCPENRKRVQKQITDNRIELIKITAVVGAILFLVQILLTAKVAFGL